MSETTTLPVEQISAKARDVHFGRTVATAFAWIFVAIGWIFGVIWHGIVFIVISARYGFWRGIGLSDADIDARLSPPVLPEPDMPQPRGSRL